MFISEIQDCDFFIQYIQGYFSLPGDRRKILKEKDPELLERTGVSEMMVIWDTIIQYREHIEKEQQYKELRRILGKQDLTPLFDHMNMVDEIRQNETPEGWQWGFIFLYGYILGKQAERSRRKKVNVVTV